MKVRNLLGLPRPLKPVIITSQPTYHRAFSAFQDQIAEARRTLRDILRGTYDRETIQEEERGFKILNEKLTLLLTRATCLPTSSQFAARLDLILSLKNLGYEVVVLVPAKSSILQRDENFIEVAKHAGAVQIIETDEENAVYITWPRDNFVQIGDILFVDPLIKDISWFEKLGVSAQVRREFFLGEGGNFLLGDNFVLLGARDLDYSYFGFSLASQYKKIEANAKKTFEEVGFNKVFTLPSAWVDLFPQYVLDEFGSSKRFLFRDDHIDRVALVLRKEKVLGFNAQYYAQHQKLLDRIAEETGYQCCLIPDKPDHACNSLELPYGGVLMDGTAKEARGVLAAFAQVYTTQGSYGDFGPQGGMRCATNILWVPEG